MNCESHLPRPRGLETTRRWFLEQCGIGVGKIGLATLLAGAAPRVLQGNEPLALCDQPGPGFGKAKAVIHLFMAGAPSHLDLFDYKPELVKYDGKSLPPSIIGDQRYAFIRSDAAVMAPRFQFSKHGQCGMELAETLPHLGSIADDLCLVRSVKTDQFNHAPAQIFFTTGFAQPGRASMGS